MVADLSGLPTRSQAGAFHVVVESPRGSRAKMKYEPELRVIKFVRPLPSGLCYPYDWGFVSGTKAEDGDPLDAMVFSDVSTFPGVVVECRALGVIRLEQNSKGSRQRERNDRLIVIPTKMPRFEGFKAPEDLPERWRKELEEFFIAVTRFEKKDAKILGWSGPKAGESMVDRLIQSRNDELARRSDEPPVHARFARKGPS